MSALAVFYESNNDQDRQDDSVFGDDPIWMDFSTLKNTCYPNLIQLAMIVDHIVIGVS